MARAQLGRFFNQKKKKIMKIEEMHIGQRVRDIVTGWEMTIVVLGVLNLDMDGPYVYVDFEGNEGGVIEYKPEDLEEVKDGKEKE